MKTPDLRSTHKCIFPFVKSLIKKKRILQRNKKHSQLGLDLMNHFYWKEQNDTGRPTFQGKQQSCQPCLLCHSSSAEAEEAPFPSRVYEGPIVINNCFFFSCFQGPLASLLAIQLVNRWAFSAHRWEQPPPRYHTTWKCLPGDHHLFLKQNSSCAARLEIDFLPLTFIFIFMLK